MTIYEIDARLTDLIDPETGELRDFDEFAALQMERDTKVENTALWIKNLLAESKAIREEEVALADRRRIAENKAKRLKEYLGYALNGSKFSTPRVSVSFRKSQAVELDESFIAWAADNAPHLLKFKDPEPDKTAISNSIKGGESYEHARIVEHNNIQIK